MGRGQYRCMCVWDDVGAHTVSETGVGIVKGIKFQWIWEREALFRGYVSDRECESG